MWIRLGLVMSVVLPVTAEGHDGPHHVIDRLTAALQREPQRVDLLIERAVQHRLAEHGAASLADLQRAAALDPGNPQIELQRGHALVLLGRHADAERAYTQFLASKPHHATARAARARARAAIGRAAAAITDYDLALGQVDDLDWYLERGLLLEAAGQLDVAAQGYARGLTRLSGGVALRQALIRVEIARGEYDGALRLITEAQQQATARTGWMLQRAEVLQAAGRTSEAGHVLLAALSEAERVLALRHTPMNLYQRARVHLALQDVTAARHDLQAALQAAPRFRKASKLLEALQRPPAHSASQQERADVDPSQS